MPYEDGLSSPEILQSSRASHELLAESGVDDSSLPENYDPNAVI